MSETVIIKRRKSTRLSPEQFKKLKAHRSLYGTVIECAESLGVSRSVLDRVLLAGSGSPESIQKILEKI